MERCLLVDNNIITNIEQLVTVEANITFFSSLNEIHFNLFIQHISGRQFDININTIEIFIEISDPSIIPSQNNVIS
nr:9085_t:CDS:2 [Entrophospora candida]